MGILMMTGFLGFIGWGALFWRHVDRGAHFPVRIGEKVVINHPLRDCRVTSFTVTRGPVRREWMSGGEGRSYLGSVAQYEATLDVVSHRPGITMTTLVVGMGSTGQVSTSEYPVLFTTKRPHQTVTVKRDWPGGGPTYLLLRDPD
jgi:hypothetical protein